MSLEFPVMKGRAAMAMGADDYFEVPLFSHVIDNLWQGCSPAEFPDEHTEGGRSYYTTYDGKVRCKWLYEFDSFEGHVKPRFDKILNLYQWGEYVVPEGTERITVEAYDGHEVDG